jgi:hypothetical protein
VNGTLATRSPVNGPPAARLPSTSAAPHSEGGVDPSAARLASTQLAVELESRRRTITLGFSLLLIPTSAALVLTGATVIGVPMVWLPVCVLAGLSFGPALTATSLAMLNLVGAPRVRRRFRANAQRLGLPAHEVDEVWRQALDTVDANVRARLSRRTQETA